MVSELPPQPESDTDRLIRLAVEQAQLLQEQITDQAARLISGALHGGQASAMYCLASSGAIEEAQLRREVLIDYTDPGIDDDVKPWLIAVERYASVNGDRDLSRAGTG